VLDHRGPELFYFGTWARARWRRGDNAVVRRPCRGGGRAWLPAGVFCYQRATFSSLCCRGIRADQEVVGLLALVERTIAGVAAK
jgi:hypothetical protein